jgi:hypothetical protein
LRGAAGAGFAGLLVFAPLNFGSTRAGGSEIIALTCTIATLLWFASCVRSGHRPQVPAAAAGAAVLLVLAAVPWITGLVSPTPVAVFTETHFARVVAHWPFSIVWRTPINTLALILALAASALALIDLARSPGWALTFSLSIALTGSAVALLAMLQNHTAASGIYWRNDGPMPGTFCGTFYHHTAAGAYFNTAWPVAVALAWLTLDRASWALTVVGGLAVVSLLAGHGSHVSRFPQLAALLVAPFLLRSLQPWNRRRRLSAAGAAILAALLITFAGRPDTIGERWRAIFVSKVDAVKPITPPESAWLGLIRDDMAIPNTSHFGGLGDRGEGWRTAGRSIAARPLTGHGPGNWMGAASQHSVDPFVRTFFQFLQFAHQDLLQFAVEWGVPAALGWWSLLAGGLIAVVSRRRWLSPLHRQIGIAAACALTAVLLQAQLDFPLEMPAIALNVVVLTALCWAGGVQRVVTAPTRAI